MTHFSSSLRRRGFRGGVLLILVAALLTGGCEDGELLPPDPAGGDLFARYVSIGNSITAGFQSSGIDSSLQKDAYPNVLAMQMGTAFNLPLLNAPGCPPPLVQIFPVPQTQGGDQAPPCALRSADTPPVLNNVAVPGATVANATTNNASQGAATSALTTFILGGRTQVEAARAAQPTFISAWIGNNDVLGAALVGEPALATPTEDFTSRYGDMLSALGDMPDLEGAVLFSVVDASLTPFFSPGAAYAQVLPQAQGLGILPPNLVVDASCAPTASGGVGDQMLVPFQYGVALVSVARSLDADLGDAAPDVTLNCAQDQTVEEAIASTFGGVDNIPPTIGDAIADVDNVSLLQAAEIGAIKARVQAYNSYIQQEADSRGYAYVDVNALFQEPELSQQIPLFPELFDNPQTPWGPDQPFGPLFSLDGVHPSTAGHEVVAGAAIDAINGTYGTSIPPLNP